MLQKLNTHHKRSKLFLSPVNSTSALFGIRHFAGTVYYSAKGKEGIIVTSNLHDIFESFSGFTDNKTFGFQGKVYGLPISLNVCLGEDNVLFQELQ